MLTVFFFFLPPPSVLALKGAAKRQPANSQGVSHGGATEIVQTAAGRQTYTEHTFTLFKATEGMNECLPDTRSRP